MSWIHIDDLCAAVIHLINRQGAGGTYNFCAPDPVPHRLFMERLAKTMHRHPPFGIPVFLIRGILGEMSQELLLASQRIVPTRLAETGYRFMFSTVDKALASLFP